MLSVVVRFHGEVRGFLGEACWVAGGESAKEVVLLYCCRRRLGDRIKLVVEVKARAGVDHPWRYAAFVLAFVWELILDVILKDAS